jgi:uncharacterized protein YbaP (TraB family)
MLRKLLFISTLLLKAGTLLAQPKSEKSLLWEINGKGLKSPSYLFGTIHVICTQDLKISAALKRSLKKSTQLYLELDIDDPSFLISSMKGILMSGDTTLKDLLSKEDYELLTHFFDDTLQMKLSIFERIKPLMLGTFMYSKMLGCQQAGSYEAALVKLAQENKKEVLGLETLDEQMAVIDKIPFDRQAQLLMATIGHYANTVRELQLMIESYKQEDVEKLYQAMQNSSSGMQEYEKDFLSLRNQKWVPQMEQIMLANSTLFAVGAGHLGGQKGVISLLRHLGYQVKAIKK